MSVTNFNDIVRHVGHNIQAVTYGKPDAVANASIECEDCNEVLLDYDNEA